MDNGCLANILVTIWHVQDVKDISLKSMETLFIFNTGITNQITLCQFV